MSNSNQLTAGLATGAFCVGAGCLVVSMFQAAGLVINHVPDPLMKWMIVLGIGCALLTSQVLTRMFIPLLRCCSSGVKIFAMLVLLGTVFTIESFSVSTSSVTFDGGMINARKTQNMNSPERAQYAEEARRISTKIERKEAQILALQQQKNALPGDHVSNRKAIQSDIDRLEYSVGKHEKELRQANTNMNTVKASTVGAAMDRMEEATGISQTNIGLVFGLLMSLCPLSVNLVAGALRSAPSREAKVAQQQGASSRVKKHRSHLRAVS